MVVMTKMAFREDRLSEELTWTTMVLLLKGRGDYREIGLVEVIWNMSATILNNRLRAYISVHDYLHGF